MINSALVGCAFDDAGRPLTPFAGRTTTGEQTETGDGGTATAAASDASEGSAGSQTDAGGGTTAVATTAPADSGDDPPADTGALDDGGTSTTGPDPCDAVELCDNGEDDNCDGMTDCQDPACAAQVCLASACHGGFCAVDPTCVEGRCAWSGTNCAPCPDGYAVRDDCWDGDWFACNVPAGWSAAFDPDPAAFPEEDWQDLGNGCAVCNTHGPAQWVITAP